MEPIAVLKRDELLVFLVDPCQLYQVLNAKSVKAMTPSSFAP
jgi:hypothetical protein